MNLLQKYEAKTLKALDAKIPRFRAGDSVRVHVRVKEGERERIQLFEGVCIARRKRGLSSSFTVRKVSYGEGVERVFPLYSPRIKTIEVVREGKVRRAKLYYLRGLSGRKARIDARTTKIDAPALEETLMEEDAAENVAPQEEEEQGEAKEEK